jgi:hypothetical protein
MYVGCATSVIFDIIFQSKQEQAFALWLSEARKL